MPQDAPSFLGRGWRFPPRFDLEDVPDGGHVGHSAMVAGEADIGQSLEVLMFTILGERVMRPTYGLGIQMAVFDGTDPVTLTNLRARIEKAVLFYEPRIKLTHVDFGQDGVMQGRLDIHLEYDIPTTNSRGNRVFPYYFREATHAAG
ncbi:MAG: GPW/gp25 family protein [Paracoccaceae bacterium]